MYLALQHLGLSLINSHIQQSCSSIAMEVQKGIIYCNNLRQFRTSTNLAIATMILNQSINLSITIKCTSYLCDSEDCDSLL